MCGARAKGHGRRFGWPSNRLRRLSLTDWVDCQSANETRQSLDVTRLRVRGESESGVAATAAASSQPAASPRDRVAASPPATAGLASEPRPAGHHWYDGCQCHSLPLALPGQCMAHTAWAESRAAPAAVPAGLGVCQWGPASDLPRQCHGPGVFIGIQLGNLNLAEFKFLISERYARGKGVFLPLLACFIHYALLLFYSFPISFTPRS